MRSISRILIELSWNLSIEPDRAHEKTLEELSCHGDSTPVSLSYVSAIARRREKKLTGYKTEANADDQVGAHQREIPA